MVHLLHAIGQLPADTRLPPKYIPPQLALTLSGHQSQMRHRQQRGAPPHSGMIHMTQVTSGDRRHGRDDTRRSDRGTLGRRPESEAVDGGGTKTGEYGNPRNRVSVLPGMRHQSNRYMCPPVNIETINRAKFVYQLAHKIKKEFIDKLQQLSSTNNNPLFILQCPIQN